MRPGHWDKLSHPQRGQSPASISRSKDATWPDKARPTWSPYHEGLQPGAPLPWSSGCPKKEQRKGPIPLAFVVQRIQVTKISHLPVIGAQHHHHPTPTPPPSGREVEPQLSFPLLHPLLEGCGSSSGTGSELRIPPRRRYIHFTATVQPLL